MAARLPHAKCPERKPKSAHGQEKEVERHTKGEKQITKLYSQKQNMHKLAICDNTTADGRTIIIRII